MPDAFGVFYARHAPAVTAYLACRVDSAEVALDLTAEVFEAALVGRNGYRAADGPARAWLYGIARHKLARSLRHRAVDRALRWRLRVPVLLYTDDALDEAHRRMDAARDEVVADLHLLPPGERYAVLARVVEDRSYKEIATATDLSEATVRKRVSRGLARLRLRAIRRQRPGGVRG